MRVSVLIPAHNYARFVGTAVESVLAQTYPGPVECTVVDDGSTDGTAEVLEAYRSRVALIRQENQGMAAALNAAYAACSGDIVCLLDADDAWKPGKLSAVVEGFEKSPGVGLVYHDVETVDEHGQAVPAGVVSCRPADGDVAPVMRKKCLRWMFRPTSTLCLSRATARHVFPLVTALRGNADDLVAPTAALLGPVRFVPERLSLYRVHGGNLWAGRQPSRATGGERVSGKAGARFQDVDAWEEPRRYCRLLEVKTGYANRVMARAGRPAGFSPWLDWTYVKYRARLDGASPLLYTGQILRAAAGLGGVGILARFAVATRLVRRSLKNRRPTGVAPIPPSGGGSAPSPS